ncbi:uncharacterized protein LOC144652294 [Oculina patagonica]
MLPKTIVLQMDFDKTLWSPKVTSQDWYYKYKLKTHQMGIYCANDDIIHCFLYNETTGTIGPNEVISLLDYLLLQLENKLGKHDHVIIWCDNCPGQFKECYLFFFLDFLVKKGRFVRADLKFLLEGHTYSVCDRRFGTIQKLFKNQEIVDVPRTWVKILENGNLSNVTAHWVTLEMIKDYKTFLRLHYVRRNEDLEKQKFRVQRIAWLNFGYGEVANEDGQLELLHHPECVFVRTEMDAKQTPMKVSFVKMRQCHELRPEFLEVVHNNRIPIPSNVKRNCVDLAEKYLSERAVTFYHSLPSVNTEKKGEGSERPSDSDSDSE